MFEIGSNEMRDLMSNMLNMIEKKTLKPEDVDRIFIQVNASGEKKSKVNPLNTLVRHEFLEFMLRCAIAKFSDHG